MAFATIGPIKGVDYAWPPHPPVPALVLASVTFVARYLSTDPSKNLSASERDQLLGAGLKIALVWETYAARILAGHDAGVSDAQAADGQCKALAMAGIPLYFACDFDAGEANQALINGYLDGAASVIGRNRTGIYGGYWPVKRSLDAAKVTYAWQTYAWSGGNWDPRAQLRQVLNGVRIDGVSVDIDTAQATDFGQWPRPGTPPPPPPPPSDWQVTMMRSLPTLKTGSTQHADVRRAQALLGPAGAPVAEDGIFGPNTEAAVKKVQHAHSMTADGIIGQATWTLLVTGAR